MKGGLISLLLLVSFFSRGQVYIHDTTSFDGTILSFLTSAYEVDTGFYVMGTTVSPEHGALSELALGFIHQNGTQELLLKDFDTLNDQMVYGGVNKLIVNERGNFVYCYRNCDTSNCYPRIKEIDPNGVVILDKKFDFLLDSLNTSVGGDFNDFIQIKYDSSYVISCGIFGNLPDRGNFNLYIHLDSNFEIIDTMTIIPPSGWSHWVGSVVGGEDGNITYLIPSGTTSFPGSSINFQSRARLLKIDENDNIVSDEIYTDGQRITIPLGLCKSLESGYLFTYIREHWDGSNWDAVHYIGKVDEDFNYVWNKTIRKDTFETYNQFVLQQEIKTTLDGNYVVTGGFPNQTLTQSSAMLTKFTENGDLLWQRYLHLPNDGSNPAIEIKDVITTMDSGFCMVGAATFFSPTFQRGYIVKTNCLGYLSEAEAALSYSYPNLGDSLRLQFVNESVQAGSFSWIMGNGDTILTTEQDSDTLVYSYSKAGIYDVTFIAHGCNGGNDTLRFEINAGQIKDTTSTYVGDGTLLSVFPNPSNSNSTAAFYIGKIPNEAVSFELYNTLGQLVYQLPDVKSESTYLLPVVPSSGMYFARLRTGNAFLETEKWVFE